MSDLSHTINPVVLITGGAKRIGAAVTNHLHANNFNVVIHYRDSKEEASALAHVLNSRRANSAITIHADLTKIDAIDVLASQTLARWGRINALVNNASCFYPTAIGSTTERDWNDLMDSNLKAPFFLAQALAKELAKSSGCIINMADIYADKPLKKYSVYSMAKAANAMLTKALAVELAPNVRVNGVAPGGILWPENSDQLSQIQKDALLAKVPLQRLGDTSDIAKTILFLIKDAPYINGQIIAVDGGRNLTI